MTEAEWHSAFEPDPLLDFLGAGASPRKLRLFGVACCRSIAMLLPDSRSRTAVDVVEKFADGDLEERNVRDVEDIADQVFRKYRNEAEESLLPWDSTALTLAASAVRSLAGLEADFEGVGYTLADVMRGVANQAAAATSDHAAESFSQARFLRDIFGNPFRSVALDPTWLTSDVLALARGIYDDRAFDRMPILADALQDAGCNNNDILNHCRDTSLTHVRGCWVVDLLSERE